MTAIAQLYEDVQVGNVLDIDDEGWVVVHRTARQGDMYHFVVQDPRLDYHIMVQAGDDQAYLR